MSVEKFDYKTDVNTLADTDCGKLELNEIGVANLNLSEKVCFDDYQKIEQQVHLL